jgi:hypothetical protein
MRVDKDHIINKLPSTLLGQSPVKGSRFIPLSVVTYINLKGTPCFVLPFYLEKCLRSEQEELLHDLANVGFGEKDPYYLVVTTYSEMEFVCAPEYEQVLASVSLKKEILGQTEISDYIPELKNDNVVSSYLMLEPNSEELLEFISFEINRIALTQSNQPTYSRVRVK